VKNFFNRAKILVFLDTAKENKIFFSTPTENTSHGFPLLLNNVRDMQQPIISKKIETNQF
jgi:hypothetical protein